MCNSPPNVAFVMTPRNHRISRMITSPIMISRIHPRRRERLALVLAGSKLCTWDPHARPASAMTRACGFAFDIAAEVDQPPLRIRHSAFGIRPLAFGLRPLAFGLWHLA